MASSCREWLATISLLLHDGLPSAGTSDAGGDERRIVTAGRGDVCSGVRVTIAVTNATAGAEFTSFTGRSFAAFDCIIGFRL